MINQLIDEWWARNSHVRTCIIKFPPLLGHIPERAHEKIHFVWLEVKTDNFHREKTFGRNLNQTGMDNFRLEKFVVSFCSGPIAKNNF